MATTLADRLRLDQNTGIELYYVGQIIVIKILLGISNILRYISLQIKLNRDVFLIYVPVKYWTLCLLHNMKLLAVKVITVTVLCLLFRLISTHAHVVPCSLWLCTGNPVTCPTLTCSCQGMGRYPSK